MGSKAVMLTKQVVQKLDMVQAGLLAYTKKNELILAIDNVLLSCILVKRTKCPDYNGMLIGENRLFTFYLGGKSCSNHVIILLFLWAVSKPRVRAPIKAYKAHFIHI